MREQCLPEATAARTRARRDFLSLPTPPQWMALPASGFKVDPASTCGSRGRALRQVGQQYCEWPWLQRSVLRWPSSKLGAAPHLAAPR